MRSFTMHRRPLTRTLVQKPPEGSMRRVRSEASLSEPRSIRPHDELNEVPRPLRRAIRRIKENLVGVEHKDDLRAALDDGRNIQENRAKEYVCYDRLDEPLRLLEEALEQGSYQWKCWDDAQKFEEETRRRRRQEIIDREREKQRQIDAELKRIQDEELEQQRLEAEAKRRAEEEAARQQRLREEEEERERQARMPRTCPECDGTCKCQGCGGRGFIEVVNLCPSVPLKPDAPSKKLAIGKTPHGRTPKGCKLCFGWGDGDVNGDLHLGCGKCSRCQGKGKIVPGQRALNDKQGFRTVVAHNDDGTPKKAKWGKVRDRLRQSVHDSDPGSP